MDPVTTEAAAKKPVAPPPPLAVKMISVESSNVAAIGYVKPTLYVRFHSGGEYKYSGVPESLFHDFMAADSKGGFLAAHIKGRFPYAKTVIKEAKQLPTGGAAQ